MSNPNEVSGHGWVTCLGCPKDKAWAIIKEGKLFRITFSKSLAEHIVKTTGGWFEVARITLKLGDEVPKGKKAKTGLYAILSRKSDIILRVCLDKKAAEIECDYVSRYIREGFISSVDSIW